MTDAPNIKNVPPGPKAKKIVEMDDRYIALSTKTSPIVAESAKNSVVTDVDGNTLIDFASGIGVINTGHCHPKVVKAVQEQAAKLMHFAGTDFYYAKQAELAKRLTEVSPGNFNKKVFLVNSGTEAIECAIKVSRWATQRTQHIGFLGAFHGRTMGSLSFTSSKTVQRARFFPTMPGVTHIPYAYCYRCPYKMNYPDCDLWCAKILDEVYFEKLVEPTEVASIFFEPVQGEGGYVVPPKGFLTEMDKIAKKYGILTVDDEVQAGFGRTGKMFAIEHFGLEPDIMAIAKGMGSGMPIGACIHNEKYDFGVQGAHSNTYGGNLVSSAAALATIDVVQDGLIENAERLGKLMAERQNEMFDKYPLVGDNRGLGLMRVIEYVKDRKTKEPAKKERDAIVEECYKKGLVLLPCGNSGIRLIPPLTIEDDLMLKGMDILEETTKKFDK